MKLARPYLILALLASLSACGEKSGPNRAAIEIDASSACDLDGMLLADYPGPKVQIFYGDDTTPIFNCDTVEMFNTLLRPEQIKSVRAVYVQDMGQANWDEPRGHWIDAKTAFYVLGSKRHGAMGPTIASFKLEADAKKFASDHGGRVLPFGEVTLEMVDLRGGANHDSKM